MPGNPVSCLCAYDLFAGPAVRRLGGRPMEMAYRHVTLPLARKIASAVGRVDYVRVAVRDDQVEPLATSGRVDPQLDDPCAEGFVLVPRATVRDARPARRYASTFTIERSQPTLPFAA